MKLPTFLKNPFAALRRWLLPLLALAMALNAGYLIATTAPDTALRAPENTPPPAPAQADAVAGAGLVEPASELIAIAAPAPGLVEKVSVRAGQRVRAGELLFEIDPRSASAELARRRAAERSAAAALTAADVEHARADDELARYEAIGDPRAMTADELSRRRFALQAAEAQRALRAAELELARANGAAAQTALDLLRVRAPLDATVLQVRARPGEFAAATRLEEPLITLGVAEPLHLRIDIDEADIGRLRTDRPARVYTRGSERAEALAEFLRVEPLVIPKRSLTNAAGERVDTRVLQVIYRLPPQAEGFYVGQQVDAFIDVARRPATAAARDPDA
jgi:HlyD family secretion protein